MRVGYCHVETGEDLPHAVCFGMKTSLKQKRDAIGIYSPKHEKQPQTKIPQNYEDMGTTYFWPYSLSHKSEQHSGLLFCCKWWRINYPWLNKKVNHQSLWQLSLQHVASPFTEVNQWPWFACISESCTCVFLCLHVYSKCLATYEPFTHCTSKISWLQPLPLRFIVNRWAMPPVISSLGYMHCMQPDKDWMMVVNLCWGA